MTAKTHKIETVAGVVTTRTPRRFIAVEARTETFVARTTTFVHVARGAERAEVEARAAVEAARRGITEEIVVDRYAPHAGVVKRTDSVSVAKAAAAKVGGFVFDTETGERV